MTHFMDLQDLRILRGPKMENRSPFGAKTLLPFPGWDPRNWPFGDLQTPKLAKSTAFWPLGGQNSIPQRGNLSWGPQIWPKLAKFEAPDLGSGPPRPSIGGLRPQIWAPRDPILGQNWPFPGHSGLLGTPILTSGRSK